MGTIAVTGAASGMGLATATRLRRDGHTVLGVHLQDADVVADLATPDGRRRAIVELGDRCGGVLDGLATFAGVGGLPGRPGSLLVSVNYWPAPPTDRPAPESQALVGPGSMRREG